MGLNHFAAVAMLALLGGASVLHAETADQPSPAAPTSDPALQASPIAGSESAAQPAASVEPAPSAEPSAPPAAESTAPVQTKGDVLTVPKQKPAATKKKKASSTPIRLVEDGMPGRGVSMNQVEQHFGPPRDKLAPVGTPPITRWIYSDYTVYFEHEYVVHSVRNSTATETAPAAAAPASPVAPATPAQEQPMAPQAGEAPATQPATAPVPSEPPAAVEPATTTPATGQ